MLKIKLNSTQRLFKQIPKKIVKEMTYEIRTKVVDFHGEEFAGFFGVSFFDEKNKFLGRKIKWFKKSSKKEQELKLIFNSKTSNIKIQYYFNMQVPIRSNIDVKLTPLNEIIPIEINEKEEFDDEWALEIPHEEIDDNKLLQLEENIVWLFASPRSGTTWLGTKLLSHNAFTINEPKIGNHLDMFSTDFSKTPNFLDTNDNYFFSKKYKTVWSYHIKKLILNRFYVQFKNHKKKIIIKEPLASHSSKIISDCFPRSKIILLLRDGRDVIDSLVDAASGGWITEAEGKDIQNDRLNYIQKQSHHWNNRMRLLLETYEMHDEKLKLMIKYEDLLKETEIQLKKIFDFIQIDVNEQEIKEIVEKYSFENIPDDKKGPGKRERSATPGKWKDNLSENEIKVMENIIKKTLIKIGYC